MKLYIVIVFTKLSNFDEQEDPFYVVDLSDIERKLQGWKNKLPRVEPFYGDYINVYFHSLCLFDHS